jgi:hypothetical protein
VAHLSLFLLGVFQTTLDGAWVTGFESAKAEGNIASYFSRTRSGNGALTMFARLRISERI